MNWDAYSVFDPGVDRPLDELPRQEAKRAFDRLMAQKAGRVSALVSLCLANGLELSTGRDSIQRLNSWFLRELRSAHTGEGDLQGEWYSIINDIALFLGDILVTRFPGLSWVFYTLGRSDASYHRPVVMGFKGAQNKKYNLDLDFLIGTYAHSAVRGEDVEPSFFVQILDSASSLVGTDCDIGARL